MLQVSMGLDLVELNDDQHSHGARKARDMLYERYMPAWRYDSFGLPSDPEAFESCSMAGRLWSSSIYSPLGHLALSTDFACVHGISKALFACVYVFMPVDTASGAMRIDVKS